MSMQFRYKLAKETFKGKKVPPKDDLNEEHISADQRGNNNFVKKVRSRSVDSSPKNLPGENLLELDRNTVTETEIQKTPENVSRRDLFSIFNPATYTQEVGQEKKAQKHKKKKKKKLVHVKAKSEQSQTVRIVGEKQNLELGTVESLRSIKSKPGLFSRFWVWLKTIFSKPTNSKIETEIVETTSTQGNLATSELEALKSEEKEEPVESEIKFRIVQKGVDLEPEQMLVNAKVSLVEEESKEEPDPEDPEVNRRNLMRQGVHFFAKPAVENISNKIDTVNRSIDKITKRKAVLRPPGAITEKQFLQACTRCDACIHACPKDAIRRTPKSHGFLVMGTPYIEPIKTPCVMCTDLNCISACEDGALKPVGNIFDVSMGYAILDQKKCKAFSNSPCQQCVIDCPIPGAITQNKDLQPEFHKNICTGCGVCVRSCHTVNTPVAIKIKPQMVIDNQLLKKKLEREKREKGEETQMAEQAAATAEAAAQAAAKFFGSHVEKDLEDDDS